MFIVYQGKLCKLGPRQRLFRGETERNSDIEREGGGGNEIRIRYGGSG